MVDYLMTYLFNKDVFIGGPFGSDMFGRVKISEPYTLFDSAHRYQDSGDYSDETSGTGSATHLPNESTVALAIGSTSGDSITRESRRVFPYQPGKSLQIMQTFVMNAPEANLRQRVGLFSRQNGIYLEVDGTTVTIVRRTYTSGSVVEEKVAQDFWNGDFLDGTGASGLTLDLTKAQIFTIEIEWLGVGSVRTGFVINGNFITAHTFHHANLIDSVYMTTASLPVRYEITNTGSTSGTSTMKQICATVISNGGYTPRSSNNTAKRTTPVSVGTDFYPIAAIRMASGRTDSVILPTEIDILPTAAGDFEWELIKNPSSLTNGSWTTHPTNNVEYTVAATAVSGGTRVRGGFFTSSNQAKSSISLDGLNEFEMQLGRTNASSPVSDVYVLAVRTLSSTATIVGSLSWNDIL